MAKIIRLSDDAATTWYELPGSEGSFEATAEEIEDTILGQNYDSKEIGLIEWGVSSNGIFKGFAGYLAKVLKTGITTAMTGEACSLESTLIYAIDDAAKQIWDRATAVTVKDDTTTVSAADIEWIDYLFGRVKFVTGYTVGGAITVSGNYFPTAEIASGKSYSLEMSSDAIDTTDFATAQANSGHKTFNAKGLKSVSLEISGIFSATEAAAADLVARTELICEVDPAGDGSSIARGFFKYINTSQDGAVGALEGETLRFSLTVPFEDKLLSPFSWQHASTTLATAIQIAIDAWLTEDDTTLVQYLPQGSAGQSPTDGKQGTVIFTNISLSGGLSDMNIFQVEMMGDGAYTTI